MYRTIWVNLRSSEKLQGKSSKRFWRMTRRGLRLEGEGEAKERNKKNAAIFALLAGERRILRASGSEEISRSLTSADWKFFAGESQQQEEMFGRPLASDAPELRCDREFQSFFAHLSNL